MKICFAGPANSAHIVKWCAWFNSRGHETHVVSFTPGEIPGTRVHLVDIGVDAGGSDAGKLKYLLNGGRFRKIIREIGPDIVNAHYATSYGMVMALSGVRGYVLSVWGSDIYDFPNRSPLHRAMLKYSLKKAGRLFSTSKAMAEEASKYTGRPFEITPFGVDMDLFSPDRRTREPGGPFTFGTVKTLSAIYGIDDILRAAALLKQRRPELPFELRIAGDGPDEAAFRQLAAGLGIEKETCFLGRISQQEAAKEWANMDAAVIPSVQSESFGVAAVEAQACETPVIISDVAGLKETTLPGESSLVVPRRDPQAVADALLRLADDPELRARMGRAGRGNALEKFELDRCFEHILSLYAKQAPDRPGKTGGKT